MPDSIIVRVKAFALLRETLGFTEISASVAPGTDVAGLLAQLAVTYPHADLPRRRFTAAVNRTFAPPDRVLLDGDEVALLPPVSGGSRKLFEISELPLSLDDVAARVVAPDRGGITLFAGAVRGITGRAETQGGPLHTDYLEYEAFPEMAEAKLAEIAAEAQARWPSVSSISIVHRVGRLNVGDTAVVIAVAAAHRQETFDACHYVIDRVKQVAPIWKKEVGPNGEAWIEGPESVVG